MRLSSQRLNSMKIRFLVALLLLSTPLAIKAKMPADIQFLINEVKHSNCTFIRNGASHSANSAAKHLELKYNNGKSYAKNGELFIKNLASKSSWTGITYKIKCPNKEAVTSKFWLNNKLRIFNKSMQNR